MNKNRVIHAHTYTYTYTYPYVHILVYACALRRRLHDWWARVLHTGAEYYKNEIEVGDAFHNIFQNTQLQRTDVFVTGKVGRMWGIGLMQYNKIDIPYSMSFRTD